MSMARKVGIGNVRPRLFRCADGKVIDIADALEAERRRIAAATAAGRRKRSRGIAAVVSAGCFAAIVIILFAGYIASCLAIPVQ
jgi:hypothetical protein